MKIPSSVTSIGDYAFDGCSSELNVHLACEQVPSVGWNCFSKVNTLYVPFGTKSLYEGEEWTRAFAQIVEYDATDVERVAEPLFSFQTGRGFVSVRGAAKNAVVSLFGTDGTLKDQTTTANGEAEWRGLTPGVYVLRCGNEAVKVRVQ